MESVSTIVIDSNIGYELNQPQIVIPRNVTPPVPSMFFLPINDFSYEAYRILSENTKVVFPPLKSWKTN